MNKVILIGRLTKDPELRTTSSNISVATFSIAVTRPYNPQGGDPGADFINCVVWRKQAENLAKYCHKGSQIAIEGRIQTRNYVAQDGNKRYITEVVCDNITFLGGKSDNQNSGDSYPLPEFENPSYGYNNNNFGNELNNYSEPTNNYSPTSDEKNTISDNSYSEPSATDNFADDPYKEFGTEVSLSDDDLPF